MIFPHLPTWHLVICNSTPLLFMISLFFFCYAHLLCLCCYVATFYAIFHVLNYHFSIILPNSPIENVENVVNIIYLKGFIEPM